ncbi:type IV pilus assembly protein PilF [Nitrosomonas sp. Nm84]|uniref:type IV pilus biogenesis/stability protein PilW n=1 Tax=Nitrosomonas sp. Nm84 TaxID=200124 RepID=UPI000D773B2C|nr:type IV pilus biogenesis/stability protein PilW [Nitrosomonas sp. Nm84]PXW91351.1 type IV pilus assembly protein PilF [Nitrosomonas sp. Nm84]
MKKYRLVSFIALHLLWLSACVQQTIENGMSEQAKLERAHQSAKIHTELAAEYFHRRQFDVAIEEVAEALKAQSNYAPAYNVLGLVNMAINEDNKALDNFEQAIRLAPKSSEINNNYGWFLCQHIPQRMDQAIDHFMVATQDPLYLTPEMAFTNAGLCELKRQRYHEAQVFFQKALSIQPNYLSALIGLVDIDFQRGNLASAKSKLTDLLQSNSSTPESLFLAIQIEQAKGDQLAADSYIFQLQKHFPDSKEAVAIREGKIR